MTRPDEVGRCRLTPDSPRLDRAWFQRLKLRNDEPLSNICLQFGVAPLQRGAVTKAEFLQVLQNLNVTLTDDQLRTAMEARALHRPLLSST